MDDLQEGAEKVRSILDESNEVIAREIRREAVEELQLRVEDWKGHKIDHFGELLLNGTYTVVKGEGAKEAEREVSDVARRFSFIICQLVLNQNGALENT